MMSKNYESIGLAAQKTPSVGPTTETQFVSMHDAAFECPSSSNKQNETNIQTVTLSPRTNADGRVFNYQQVAQAPGRSSHLRCEQPGMRLSKSPGEYRSLTQPVTNGHNQGALSRADNQLQNFVNQPVIGSPTGMIQSQRPKAQAPVVTERQVQNLNSQLMTQRPYQGPSQKPGIPSNSVNVNSTSTYQPQIISSSESIPQTASAQAQKLYQDHNRPTQSLMPNSVHTESSFLTELGSWRQNAGQPALRYTSVDRANNQKCTGQSPRSRMIQVYSPLYRGRDTANPSSQTQTNGIGSSNSQSKGCVASQTATQPTAYWMQHGAGSHGLTSSQTLSIGQVYNKKLLQQQMQPMQTQPVNGLKFRELTAFESDSSLVNPGSTNLSNANFQHQPAIQKNATELKMIDTYSDTDQTAFQKRLQQMQQDISRTSRLLDDHRKRQVEVAKKWCLTPTSLSSHAPTSVNTTALNQTVTTTMTQDFAKLAALQDLTTNRLQQQISAKNRELEELANSFLNEQGNSTVSGRNNAGELNAENHDVPSSQAERFQQQRYDQVQESAQFLPRSQAELPDKIMKSTEMSPHSMHGAPRLDFQELINSGTRVGRHQINCTNDLHNADNRASSFIHAHGFESASFDQSKNQHERGDDISNSYQQDNNDCFEDEEWYENQRPSTKRDQKITYSKTSLDELQFMEHFKKIRAIEDGNAPPMPMSASVRSQVSHSKNNDRTMDLMSTLHKNDVIAETDSHNARNSGFRSRNQAQLQQTTVPQRAVSEGRPTNQKKLFSQTATLPPRQESARAVHLQNQTLQNRLNQLNDLITNKQTEPVDSSSYQRYNLHSLGRDTSAEKAQQYLDTINQRQTDYQQTLRPSTQPLSQTATAPFNTHKYQDLLATSTVNPSVNNQTPHTYANQVTESDVNAYQQQHRQEPFYQNEQQLTTQDERNEDQDGVDGQLLEILTKIGVGEGHLWKFREQEIGLYDFLLLSKDDLVELGLPIALRNRIIAFQRHFQNEGLDNCAITSDFDMHEIIRQFARSESTGITALVPRSRQTYHATQVTEPGHEYSRLEPFGVTEINMNLPGGSDLLNMLNKEQKADIQAQKQQLTHQGRFHALDQLKERPKTTQGFYKQKDLAKKIESDYDDYLVKAMHLQQAKRAPLHPAAKSWERSILNQKPVAHFQSAMTQMLEANGLHRASQDNQNCAERQSSSGHWRNPHRMTTEMTDTTQPLQLTSSPTGQDDYSSSRSPIDSIKYRRPSSMINNATTGGFHVIASSPGDYSQPEILPVGQAGACHRRDKSSINTLSTSQAQISRSSVITPQQVSQAQNSLQESQKKISKRDKAKQLYKELKTLILQGAFDPYSERSHETKSSMSSQWIDQIVKKVTKRGIRDDKLIKRELKKLVRKVTGTRKKKQYRNRRDTTSKSVSSNGRNGRHRLFNPSMPSDTTSRQQHTRQPSNSNSSNKMSRLVDKWAFKQVARKQFATLTSEQQAFLQSNQNEKHGHHQMINSSCEKFYNEKSHHKRKSKRNKHKRRHSSSVVEESKYTHSAFESTHDFAKEAVDCLQTQTLRGTLQAADKKDGQGQEAARMQTKLNGQMISYADTTTFASDDQANFENQDQQNMLQSYEQPQQTNAQQYLSSNTEDNDRVEMMKLMGENEARRKQAAQVDQDNPIDTYETFDERKNQDKRRKQAMSRREKQEPHGQTYSFGFVSSNAQILTSDETRVNSSARFLKKAKIAGVAQQSGGIEEKSKRLFDQFSDQREDYIERLKQMQRDGQIGSLGMGNIDLEKLQTHLSRVTHSPSANETRCRNKHFEIQKKQPHTGSLKILQQQPSATSNSSSFYQMHYTFAGGQGSANNQQRSSTTTTQDNRKFGNVHLRGSQNITPGSLDQSTTQITMTLDNQKSTLVAQGSSMHILCENDRSDGQCESQETERKQPFPISSGPSAKEVSKRNKELLEQAKKDIAQMNEKAAAFKSKLQLAKQQVSTTTVSSAYKMRQQPGTQLMSTSGNSTQLFQLSQQAYQQLHC